ncbi:PAS domain S-box-containing protein/diguanylate cyclase (GGDEF) domain-containing protein [Pseudomonas linyingensis]|uniref:cyclic-guanylate-specific phosphodiesterase n=1 Tax=Pseudomonas linyingensis TaxID=915471 RepID=A0A1H7BGY5_9PSED|nr:EAL domain-containing protein [Pseudomonas linyingensis]SEJ72655.1 PAS domain S-box-containing protein/diguanylate cyclase (GGDEF) domain-containing protein [Pseudomonas linyingensis]
MSRLFTLRALLLSAFLGFGLLVSVYQVVSVYRHSLQEAIGELETTTDFIGHFLASGLGQGSPDTTDRVGHLFAEHLNHPALVYAAVLDDSGRMRTLSLPQGAARMPLGVPAIERLLHERQQWAENHLHWLEQEELLVGGYPLVEDPAAQGQGMVVLAMRSDTLRAHAWSRTGQQLILLLLPLLLMAVLLAWLLKRLLTDRIEELLEDVRHLSSGRIDTLPVLGSDEVGQLAAEFGALMQRVISARDYNEYLLNCIPSPVWQVDAQQRCVYVNAAWSHFTGLSQAQSLHEGWWQALHPDDCAGLESLLGPGRGACGQDFAMRLRLRARSGRHHWVQLHGAPLVGRDGQFCGYLGSAFDIQAELDAGAELQANEARFRGLVEQSLVGVYVLRDGHFEYVNPRMAEWFGYQPEELVARSLLDLVSEGDRALVCDMLERRERGELVSAHYEFRALTRDGREFMAEAFGTRIELDGLPAIIGTLLDVTQRYKDRETVQAVVDAVVASPMVMLRRQVQTGWPLQYVSENVERWGYSVAKLLDGARWFTTLIHTDDLPQVLGEVARNIRELRPEFVLEYRIRTGVGSYIWIEDYTRVHRDASGEAQWLESLLIDISARKAADEKLRHAAAVFTNAREGVVITDTSPQIIAVNRAFCDITGYEEHEVIGRNPSIVSSGRQSKEFYRDMWGALLETGHWQGEVWNRRRSGEVFPQWHSISAVRDDKGKLTNYVAVFSDISQLKESEAQLERLAHYDPLTGLPNRILVQSHLNSAIERARRQHCKVAVLFLDLDGFKRVNDSLGHSVGDELLVLIAGRLRQRIRAEDMFARLGGDEFLLILEGIGHPEEAATVAQDLINLLQQPFRAGSGHELFVGASIGISLFPDDGQEMAELIRCADVAMYQAKENGRNGYQFHTLELTRAAENRQALESRLHRAITAEEFELYYQPQVDVVSGRTLGFEALVRWRPECGEGVSPAVFIPLLEETGLILALGDWVLHQACRQAVRWREAGLDKMPVSVNLSPRQFQHLDVVELVRRALEDSGLPGELLELEITEGALMAQNLETQERLGELKALGVQLAVDDFGTGYSSLAYLSRFPIDKLKIDKSFIDGFGQDARADKIVATIIAMGQSLDLQVVAEGVENAGQLELLRALGCDAVQGYLCGRPVPAAQAQMRLLQEQAGVPA